jgi:hypothetical protein
MGTLIVQGSGPNIVFRSEREGQSFKEIVSWVGNTEIQHIHEYVIMGEYYRFDTRAAQYDLAEHIASFSKDSWPDINTPKILDEFCSDKDWNWGNQDEQRMYDELLQIYPGIWETFPLGHVPNTNLISAQAACRRMNQLLTDFVF